MLVVRIVSETFATIPRWQSSSEVVPRKLRIISVADQSLQTAGPNPPGGFGGIMARQVAFGTGLCRAPVVVTSSLHWRVAARSATPESKGLFKVNKRRRESQNIKGTENEDVQSSSRCVLGSRGSFERGSG